MSDTGTVTLAVQVSGLGVDALSGKISQRDSMVGIGEHTVTPFSKTTI